MLASSKQAVIEHLKRLKKRKKKWDSFLKRVEVNAPKKDKEFNILHLCSEASKETVERRPYRACRKYKASEKKLIFAFESYEYKYNRNRNPKASIKRERKRTIKTNDNIVTLARSEIQNKAVKEYKSLNNICTNLWQEKHNKLVSGSTLNVNEIPANKSSILPKTLSAELAETASSGYSSMANSRRASASSILTMYKSIATEMIEGMLVEISEKTSTVLKSNCLITMDIIRNLRLVYDLPKNNFQYICLYLKQSTFNVDLCSMIKLVHIIEDIKRVNLKRFIFGLRLLETLDRTTDVEFKQLSDKVNKILSNLLLVVNVDVTEIYVDFILWMFDYKKSKLN